MGIDATRKWPEEGFTRNWPKLIEMDPATRKQIDAMWTKLGLGPTERSDRWQQNDAR
jgi:4-hydroxy-3-polyprenylbenzoate decarboxylase